MRTWMAMAGAALGLAAGCGGGSGQTGAAEPEPPSSNAAPGPERPATGDGNVSEPDPGEGTDDPKEGEALGMPGSSLDSPLETCGAGESYANVANYECPDGSVPLGGDPRAGQRARRGSSRSHVEDPPSLMESHIVDVYEVPCPSGTVEVFVCMYHCPEGRSPMD